MMCNIIVGSRTVGLLEVQTNLPTRLYSGHPSVGELQRVIWYFIRGCGKKGKSLLTLHLFHPASGFHSQVISGNCTHALYIHTAGTH